MHFIQLFEDLGTFWSDAWQIVAKHWNLEPHDFDGHQQLVEHVLELYNELMEETKALSGSTQFVKNHDVVVLKNLVLQQEFRLRLNNK